MHIHIHIHIHRCIHTYIDTYRHTHTRTHTHTCTHAYIHVLNASWHQCLNCFDFLNVWGRRALPHSLSKGPHCFDNTISHMTASQPHGSQRSFGAHLRAQLRRQAWGFGSIGDKPEARWYRWRRRLRFRLIRRTASRYIRPARSSPNPSNFVGFASGGEKSFCVSLRRQARCWYPLQ